MVMRDKPPCWKSDNETNCFTSSSVQLSGCRLKRTYWHQACFIIWIQFSQVIFFQYKQSKYILKNLLWFPPWLHVWNKGKNSFELNSVRMGSFCRLSFNMVAHGHACPLPAGKNEREACTTSSENSLAAPFCQSRKLRNIDREKRKKGNIDILWLFY